MLTTALNVLWICYFFSSFQKFRSIVNPSETNKEVRHSLFYAFEGSNNGHKYPGNFKEKIFSIHSKPYNRISTSPNV